MITPSFSPTVTERVLPKLALDFTTASLDPRVTFTRTTGASNPATYVNSSGYITSATDNQPRFDYDPVTLVCKGLLIEESRTNTFVPSSGKTSWATDGSGAVILENTTTNPMGTTGNWITKATGYSYASVGTVNGTDYTMSVFLKRSASNTGDTVTFAIAGGTLTYNFATNTLSGPFGSRQGFTLYPNSVVRVWMSFTGSGASVTFNGPDSSKLMYGFQYETGTFPTSYIPTTSVALTRNADVAIMTGTNFSSWWTATTGSASVYATQKSSTGTRPLFQADDNTSSNQICLRGNAINPELYIKATTDQVQIDAGTIVANTAYKLAGAWNTNNCAAAQNGAAVVTDVSATIPTVTQARIGCDGTNYANAWIASINYWPQRITDNETQAFSK